ncbi:hypothetical protein F0562_005404 [Nyssa sinensis]|uniref:Uncharacterized protein n=1 Tax=Nyssa sinensis TaxID=561372 RepID=A0A5J5ALM2_9ASTE|nr:hypothetical protein F0562_005404 [Nyssa sinensis]
MMECHDKERKMGGLGGGDQTDGVVGPHTDPVSSAISASFGGLALPSLEARLCNLWRHVFATSGGASSGELWMEILAQLWRLGSAISGGTSLPPLEACLCHLLRRKL